MPPPSVCNPANYNTQQVCIYTVHGTCMSVDKQMCMYREVYSKESSNVLHDTCALTSV